jgi:hypothetical protein
MISPSWSVRVGSLIVSSSLSIMAASSEQWYGSVGRRSRKRERESEPGGIPSIFKRSWEMGAQLLAEHHAGASLEDMIAKRRDELGLSSLGPTPFTRWATSS